MWKTFFIAVGVCLVLLGVEGLAVDRFVMSRGGEVTPPDWAPWSLLSSGVVVILYTVTIPKRVGSG